MQASLLDPSLESFFSFGLFDHASTSAHRLRTVRNGTVTKNQRDIDIVHAAVGGADGAVPVYRDCRRSSSPPTDHEAGIKVGHQATITRTEGDIKAIGMTAQHLTRNSQRVILRTFVVGDIDWPSFEGFPLGQLGDAEDQGGFIRDRRLFSARFWSCVRIMCNALDEPHAFHHAFDYILTSKCPS